MLRVLKFLCLILALTALIVFAANCGTDHAKFRVVNASPDAGALDVAVDGKTVVTDLAFGGLSPATDYLTLSAGNRKVEFRDTGTTTDQINANVAFASQTQYTLLAIGKVSDKSIAALLKTDDNSPPPSGNIKLRVIHSAVGGPAHIDIFVVAPGTDITNATPTIAALAYQQASDYQILAAATYEVIMTDSNNRTNKVLDQTYPLTTGQIRTLVTLDAGGGLMSALELSDLN